MSTIFVFLNFNVPKIINKNSYKQSPCPILFKVVLHYSIIRNASVYDYLLSRMYASLPNVCQEKVSRIGILCRVSVESIKQSYIYNTFMSINFTNVYPMMCKSSSIMISNAKTFTELYWKFSTRTIFVKKADWSDF